MCLACLYLESNFFFIRERCERFLPAVYNGIIIKSNEKYLALDYVIKVDLSNCIELIEAKGENVNIFT